MNVIFKPVRTLFVDGYIIYIQKNGEQLKYYMKFEDGLKNVIKWNVLAYIISSLKIISPNYYVPDSNQRWLNEIKINQYLRREIKSRNLPVYVPKIVTHELKKTPPVKKFLEKFKDYRYTIFEFVEGPTLQEVLNNPDKFNVDHELKLAGRSVGCIHGLGVIQFDRRTTNDIKFGEKYCCLDFSISKLFHKKTQAYYRGLAYDMEHQRIWMSGKQFKIFKKAHDEMLSTFPDINLELYEKELENIGRLCKTAKLVQPILQVLNAV